MTDILGRFGLTRVINATGTVTRLGASPLDAEVIDAMAAAARSSVDIAELQGRACETIAEYTGAQAGIVTSGAMAGLLVGAAACIAAAVLLRFSPRVPSFGSSLSNMPNRKPGWVIQIGDLENMAQWSHSRYVAQSSFRDPCATPSIGKPSSHLIFRLSRLRLCAIQQTGVQ